MLLITHDPHLVDLVADRLWLVADGTARAFAGDMDEYRALLVERGRPAGKAEAPSRRDDRRDRAEVRAQQAPLRRQAKDAEATAGEAGGGEGRLIEAKLADPAMYAAGKAAEVTAANQRLAAIGREDGRQPRWRGWRRRRRWRGRLNQSGAECRKRDTLHRIGCEQAFEITSILDLHIDGPLAVGHFFDG